MIKKNILTASGKTAQGIEIPLPSTSLVLVSGEKGYIMCGYLNLSTAEKMGDRAGMVKGVKTIDDLLKAPIAEATRAAIAAGIVPGMTGKEALEFIV